MSRGAAVLLLEANKITDVRIFTVDRSAILFVDAEGDAWTAWLHVTAKNVWAVIGWDHGFAATET